jgi:hypothetical protein
MSTFGLAILEYLLDDCAIDPGEVEELDYGADRDVGRLLGIEEGQFGVEEAG